MIVAWPLAVISGAGAGIMSGMAETPDLILSVLGDIEPLMRAAFDSGGGTPPPGSSLDQVFLLNGREVVLDYLAHGECGLAFDHLLYMIKEPPLQISGRTARTLTEAGAALGVSEDELRPLPNDPPPS